MPHVDTLSRAHDNSCYIIGNTVDSTDGMQRKIIEVHDKIIHRGAKATKQKFEEIYGNPIGLQVVANSIKNCKTCKMYNPLKTRGFRKVTAFEVGEKVAIDIVEPKKSLLCLNRY